MTYFGNSHIIQKNIVSSFEKADTNKSAFPGTKSKDIEGTGMRWVTVRGRKVLLRGDGGVVAGGKGMDSGKDINKLKPSSGAKKQSEKSPVSATNPDEPMGVEKNKWTKEQVEAYANGQDPNKVEKQEVNSQSTKEDKNLSRQDAEDEFMDNDGIEQVLSLIKTKFPNHSKEDKIRDEFENEGPPRFGRGVTFKSQEDYISQVADIYINQFKIKSKKK